MLDPFLASTAVLGVATVGLGMALASARSSVDQARAVGEELLIRLKVLRRQAMIMEADLAAHARDQAKRVAQREDARKKALAAVQVRAAKRRAAGAK